MAHERGDEGVLLLVAVRRAHADDVVAIEGGQNGGGRILRLRSVALCGRPEMDQRAGRDCDAGYQRGHGGAALALCTLRSSC